LDRILELLLAAFGGAGVLGAVAVVYVLFYPERAEKFLALLFRFLSHIQRFSSRAWKHYQKHDLQSHINDFVKCQIKELPGFYAEGVTLIWADPKTTKDAFLKDGRVVVRLSKNDTHSANFARATYFFVSTSLLHRAKRYLAPSQGKATDLYVTSKLLRQQKPEVVDYFLETYLHPELDDNHGKAKDLFARFETLDGAGLFFSIYLRELDYLGRKVFGHKRNDSIVREVKELIDFLERFSQRRTGVDSDLDFMKEYCKFGIMIVGRAATVLSTWQPYIEYIRNRAYPKRIETLYVLGRAERVEAIRWVAASVRDCYECVAQHKYTAPLKTDRGVVKSPTYLAVLRLQSLPAVVTHDEPEVLEAPVGATRN